MYQSGFKYELPADSSGGVPPAAASVSPNLSTVSPDPSNTGGSTGFYVSPQSTGTGMGYHDGAENGHNGHISELHG